MSFGCIVFVPDLLAVVVFKVFNLLAPEFYI